MYYLPIGPKVVPFGGSYLEFYKVIPTGNYFGAYGQLPVANLSIFCVKYATAGLEGKGPRAGSPASSIHKGSIGVL